MIDPQTGDLLFDDGTRLVGRCSQDELLSLPLAKAAKAGSWSGAGLTLVKLGSHKMDKAEFLVHCYLDNGVLSKVELRHQGFGTSFADDDSPARKRKHDEWLEISLGEPPYKYRWGEITSEFLHDVKAGWDDSFIAVKYGAIKPFVIRV